MAIVFSCPNCQELYRLKDDAAGRKAPCRKCKLMLTAPKPMSAADAEAAALAALMEEAPVAVKTEKVVEKFKFSCEFCGQEHEVERSQEGKNMRCGECGKIIRVPKVIKDKPIDWRETNDGKPSLAKRDTPKLEGATEAAKMVSAEAVKEGGGFDFEEEEDPAERRARRIKQIIYGSMFLIVAFVVGRSYLSSRAIHKQEGMMERALREIEDPVEGAKRPDIQAAIHCYAGEYYLRGAKKRQDLDASIKHFSQTLGKLQTSSNYPSDHAAMMMELAATMTVLGGEPDQIRDEIRLPWDKVQQKVQQPFVQAQAVDSDQRDWGTRLLTHAFVARGQPTAIYNVARYAYPDRETECAGRVGIELLAMNQKDAATELLAKAPQGQMPALTAFKMAMGAEPGMAAPPNRGEVTLRARLAFAEGYALQGKMDEAKALAERSGPPTDRARALVLIAAVELEHRKNSLEATKSLEAAGTILLTELKEERQPGWLMVRIADLSARAGKWEYAQKIADAITDESIRAWATLEILRARIVGVPKSKCDDGWVEVISDPAKANLATLMAREEFARHNAAVGETSYLNYIEKSWPKGQMKPFGYAGTALGNQDRTVKP
jgi:hypothetical protein